MTIEEQEQEVNEKVKAKLDENNIKYTSIGTSYDKEGLIRDGTSKELFYTTIMEPVFSNIIHICSDFETQELLFVQTAPTRFMDIEDYFKKRD